MTSAVHIALYRSVLHIARVCKSFSSTCIPGPNFEYAAEISNKEHQIDTLQAPGKRLPTPAPDLVEPSPMEFGPLSPRHFGPTQAWIRDSF